MPRSSRARSRSGAQASRSSPVDSICAIRTERALRRCAGRSRLTGLEIHALVLGEHNESGGLADENADVSASRRDDVVDALAWAHRARGRGHPRPVLHALGAPRAKLTSIVRRPRSARSARSPPSGASRSATREHSPRRRSSRSPRAWTRTRSACYFDLANPLAKRGLDAPTEIRADRPSDSEGSRQGHARSLRATAVRERAVSTSRSAHARSPRSDTTVGSRWRRHRSAAARRA